MNQKKESVFITKAKAAMGNLTPLKGHDCGQLCSAACCKGDENTGMLLFPGETTTLRTITLENGNRLAVCNGTCDRTQRPLACMIFPFFPTVDEEDEVYTEIDSRAYGVCPLAAYCDDVLFDEDFLDAVQEVGECLAEDAECLAFLHAVTEQIDEINEIRDSLTPEE